MEIVSGMCPVYKAYFLLLTAYVQILVNIVVVLFTTTTIISSYNHTTWLKSSTSISAGLFDFIRILLSLGSSLTLKKSHML